MNTRLHRRLLATLAVLAASCLMLTGCSKVITDDGNGPGDVGRADGVITIYGTIRGDDAVLLEQSWADWEQEHNVTIKYRALDDFDNQIGVLAQRGDAPDLAIFSHPKVISDLVARDLIQRVPQAVKKNVRQHWSQDWAQYVSWDGEYYGAPLLASVKGLIWYSPSLFAAHGWTVPTTWNELLALTADMREQLGKEPWCAGFGTASGAGNLGADWIEDLVLRTAGPYTYDEWVAHRTSFSDPEIKHAFESLKELLLAPDDDKATFADIAISTAASTGDVATAMGSGECALAHQSVTFEGALTDPLGGNTTVGPQGAVWAFLMPSIFAGGNSVTGGGSVVAAFSNDPDTIAVQKYLSSPEWANIRVKLGGVMSANNGVDPANASSPILGKAISILQDPRTIFRFDGSAQMPKNVGSGSFPKGMVAWVGGASLKKVLSTIDRSWPTE